MPKDTLTRPLDAEGFQELVSQVLARRHQARFRVHGESMYPFLQRGDLVTVEPVRYGELRRGDIVLCRRPEGYHVVHRLVERNNGLLILRGDNWAHCDRPASFGGVLGRVAGVERQGRCHRLGSKGARALAWVLASFNWVFHPGTRKLQRGLIKLWFRASGGPGAWPRRPAARTSPCAGRKPWGTLVSDPPAGEGTSIGP